MMMFAKRIHNEPLVVDVEGPEYCCPNCGKDLLEQLAGELHCEDLELEGETSEHEVRIYFSCDECDLAIRVKVYIFIKILSFQAFSRDPNDRPEADPGEGLHD